MLCSHHTVGTKGLFILSLVGTHSHIQKKKSVPTKFNIDLEVFSVENYDSVKARGKGWG